MLRIIEYSTSVTFTIRVHPRAKKNASPGEVGNALKISLTAPPIDGKANGACLEFFAKLLKAPRSSVTIASGEASRTKATAWRGFPPKKSGGALRRQGATLEFFRTIAGNSHRF
jgi:uncharacterized protein (TIGR00251 family)